MNSTLHAGYVWSSAWSSMRMSMRSTDTSGSATGALPLDCALECLAYAGGQRVCREGVGICNFAPACLVIVLYHIRPAYTDSAAPQAGKAGKITRSESEHSCFNHTCNKPPVNRMRLEGYTQEESAE